MSLPGILEVIAFAASAFIAVAGALGMATTMSMFRSAIFLMASFMGVAGLFIVLSADLLGFLQIMMYIGGMLVMALFMVLFMHDPGGAMMAAMPEMMTPIERIFSLGLAPKNAQGDAPGNSDGHTGQDVHAGHGGGSAAHERHQGGDRHPDGDDHHRGDAHLGPDAYGSVHHEMGAMHHMDMPHTSMVTPVRAWAAWLAAAIGCALVALLLFRPSWPLSPATPDPRSAVQVGALLMDKYMIGFEGAGVLILIGIVGAVLAAHSGQHPDRRDREARVAVNALPPPIEPDLLEPLSPSLGDGDKSSPAPDGGHAHRHGPGGEQT